jgi:hypothetical protein
MKKSPMPLSGGNYRVVDGVLSRDESDAPKDDTAPAASPSAKTATTRTRALKTTTRAGSPARKRRAGD